MCNTNKRKLCLSQRLSSSRADYSILNTTVAFGENQCMINCARNADCWAFNFFTNGTCELLTALGNCGEARPQTGSVFVQLSACEGANPQEFIPRNWTKDDCLIWIPLNKESPCPPGVLMSSSNEFCLSLAPHHNLYMPGWFYFPNAFRFARDDKRSPQKCPDGYVVKEAPGCTATWQGYIPGDPIPPNAAQVSVWRDGTPLYAVEHLRDIAGDDFIGYYLPTDQKTYIMMGEIFNPTEVRILVLNWMHTGIGDLIN